MNFISLNINDPDWLTFIKQCPKATAFHHPAWINLISESYGWKSFILGGFDKGKMVAGLPIVDVKSWLTGKRLVSLPFTDYCSPLVTNPSLYNELVDGLIQFCDSHGVSRLEIRGLIPGHHAILREERFVINNLDLKIDAQQVFKTFSKKFRQYSRKGEREGLYLDSNNSLKDMHIFYNLHLKVRKKLGVPTQPKRFFRNLWDTVVSQGLGRVLIVYYSRQPVSGAVLLGFNKKAMIKYSATDPAYLDKRAHYFTFWKAIEWACQNNFKSIDFGRTDILKEGLRFFKRGWGSIEQPLYYSSISKFASLINKMDVISGQILKTAIQHSPVLVGRIIGELLYKHFG